MWTLFIVRQVPPRPVIDGQVICAAYDEGRPVGPPRANMGSDHADQGGGSDMDSDYVAVRLTSQG